MAAVTGMNTPQLRAGGFASVGQRFSSPPTGPTTSPALQLPLLGHSGDQRLCHACCHCDSPSVPHVAVTEARSETEKRCWGQFHPRLSEPSRAPDPIVPGRLLRWGFFGLSGCPASVPALPIQEVQRGFPTVWGTSVFYFLPS